MNVALRKKLVVQPGGVIEIRCPELPVGTIVEVIVIVEEATLVELESTQSVNATKQEDLGWPTGFSEQTFGCLRDEPLVREPQGEYETDLPTLSSV